MNTNLAKIGLTHMSGKDWAAKGSSQKIPYLNALCGAKLYPPQEYVPKKKETCDSTRDSTPKRKFDEIITYEHIACCNTCNQIDSVYFKHDTLNNISAIKNDKHTKNTLTCFIDTLRPQEAPKLECEALLDSGVISAGYKM